MLKEAAITWDDDTDQRKLPSLDDMRIEIDRVDTGILDTIAEYGEGSSLTPEDLGDMLFEMIEVIRFRVSQMAWEAGVEEIEPSEPYEPSKTFDSSKQFTEKMDEAIRFIEQRIEIAKTIGRIKHEKGLEVRDVQRENTHLDELGGKALEKSLPADRVRVLFTDIMSLCRNVQEKLMSEAESGGISQSQKRPKR